MNSKIGNNIKFFITGLRRKNLVSEKYEEREEDEESENSDMH